MKTVEREKSLTDIEYNEKVENKPFLENWILPNIQSLKERGKTNPEIVAYLQSALEFFKLNYDENKYWKRKFKQLNFLIDKYKRESELSNGADKQPVDTDQPYINNDGLVVLPKNTVYVFVCAYIKVNKQLSGQNKVVSEKLYKLIDGTKFETIYKYSKIHTDLYLKIKENHKLNEFFKSFENFIRKNSL